MDCLILHQVIEFKLLSWKCTAKQLLYLMSLFSHLPKFFFHDLGIYDLFFFTWDLDWFIKFIFFSICYYVANAI